jgi:succinyl-CoA synthetase beta subunit
MTNVSGQVSRLAEALALDTIEINPLRVHGNQMEVLDALVVWDKDQDKENDL